MYTSKSPASAQPFHRCLAILPLRLAGCSTASGGRGMLRTQGGRREDQACLYTPETAPTPAIPPCPPLRPPQYTATFLAVLWGFVMGMILLNLLVGIVVDSLQKVRRAGWQGRREGRGV